MSVPTDAIAALSRGKFPGRLAGRFLRAKGATGAPHEAQAFVDGTRWADAPIVKTAIGAVAANDPALANVSQDFLAAVRPMSLVGRLAFRPAAFGTRTLTTAGTAGAWMPEGLAIPLSVPPLATFAGMPARTVAALTAWTKEALRLPLAEDLVAGDLAGALAETVDAALLDPLGDGTGAAPQSLVHAGLSIPSSGSSVAALGGNLQAALAAFGGDLTRAVWVTDPVTAASLSLAMDLERLGARGGELLGLPAFTTSAGPRDSDGGLLVLLDPGSVELAADPGVVVDVADQASLVMDDNPGGSSVTPTAAQVVSMFQTNSVAFRATWAINWRLLREAAVVTLTGLAVGDGA